VSETVLERLSETVMEGSETVLEVSEIGLEVMNETGLEVSE
jgi:hypothetical protein